MAALAAVLVLQAVPVQLVVQEVVQVVLPGAALAPGYSFLVVQGKW